MGEKICFVIIALSFLGFILYYMAYRKEKAHFSGLFFCTLLLFLAFYLFQYGGLGSFSVKALSAEASFIREKRAQVAADVVEIESIKSQAKKQNQEIQGALIAVKGAEAEIANAKKELELLKQGLAWTAKMAAPPTLLLSSAETSRNQNSYVALLSFSPSKNESLGILTFRATILSSSTSKIMDFWPKGSFNSGPDSKKISDDGRKASLAYSLVGGSYPKIQLILSEPAKVLIEGSHSLKPFEIDGN